MEGGSVWFQKRGTQVPSRRLPEDDLSLHYETERVDNYVDKIYKGRDQKDLRPTTGVMDVSVVLTVTWLDNL